MKGKLLLLALTSCMSSIVNANGYGEDGSWKFQDSNEKFIRLQQRVAEEMLDNDGFGPGNTTITAQDGSTLYFGDQVHGDKEIEYSSNCVNCSSVSTTTEVGDNFSGTVEVGARIRQRSTDASQLNGAIVDTNNGIIK